jgi:hypothetical protein
MMSNPLDLSNVINGVKLKISHIYYGKQQAVILNGFRQSNTKFRCACLCTAAVVHKKHSSMNLIVLYSTYQYQ